MRKTVLNSTLLGSIKLLFAIISGVLYSTRSQKHRLAAIFFIFLLTFSATELAILGWHSQKIAAQAQNEAQYIQEHGEKPPAQPKKSADKSTTNKLPKSLKQGATPSYERVPTLKDKKLAEAEKVPQVAPQPVPQKATQLKPLDGPVGEDVQQRTSHRKVFKNADGTTTEQNYFDAVHYQEGEDWKDINTSLVEDKNAADSGSFVGRLWGKVRTFVTSTTTHKVKANDWNARFAPSSDEAGMLRLQYKGGTVSFSPVNAHSVTPVVATNADDIQTIRYNGLWDGVDVEYQVLGNSLKEFIFINNRDTQNDFAFNINGAQLQPDAKNPGGFTIKGQLEDRFAIAPIFLIRQDAGPIIDQKLYAQTYANGQLNITFKKQYIQKLPDAAFPLIIDPSTYKTGVPSGSNYRSYKSDGATCSDCLYTGSVYHDGYWRDWRSLFKLSHSSMVGKDIISAKLHVKNTTTTAPYGSSGAWANQPFRATCTSGVTCIDTSPAGEKRNITTGVAEFSVTSIMRERIAADATTTWFIIKGDERNDHTFKHLIPSQTWLTFTYSSRPSVPTPEVPSTSTSSEAVVVTTEPQIGVKSVTDSDGDDVDYAYQVKSERGIVIYETGWISNNRLTIPDGVLEDGGRYSWSFQIKDPYWASGWKTGGKFRVDERTGKDKTSSYDEVGPISVNLNTGNAYTSVDTHSTKALGGDIGLNLHYNSPLASKQGVTAYYYNNTSWTGNPVLQRHEATVDNNWASGSASQGIVPTDNFGARYRTYFIAPKDGTYTFGGKWDGGFGIYVDDVHLAGGGTCPSSVCWGTNTLTLKAGEAANMIIKYNDSTGGSRVHVYVKEASLAPTGMILPTEWLRTQPRPSTRSTGLTGYYYNDNDGTHMGSDNNKRFLVRQDPNVNYRWDEEAPVPGGLSDKFYVRWTGYFTAPLDGNYQFGAVHNDGARITVDNQVRYESWAVQAERNGYGSSVLSLSAGQSVPIKVEYFEDTGNATMQLWAKGPHNPSGAIILPEYLSPGSSFLPNGWQLSGDSSDAIMFERIEVKQSGDVDVFDADGSKDRFRYESGGFKTPANVEATLIKNSDNSYTLTDASGMVYVFNVDGTLRETSSPIDDRKPAALRFSYQPLDDGRVRLKEIIDPVDPLRKGTLYYAGDSECDESGFSSTPSGMLCAFRTYDGRITFFKYVDGRLARVVEPGNLAVDYAFDVSGMLTSIRSSLANDAIAAGVRDNNTEVLTEISYDVLSRVSSVTPPSSSAGGDRNQHTIEYLPNASKRHITNVPEPHGYIQHVVFDNLLRTTRSCDVRANCTINQWHPEKDLLLSTTDALGQKSTTIYSETDLPLHHYGPAPASRFGSDNRPLAEYADTIPHSETRYDESISGPAVAYYDVKKFDTSKLVLFGGPKIHTTGNNNNAKQHAVMVGEYDLTSPYVKADGMDGVGISTTGRVQFPGSGTYTLTANHDDSLRVWIDDKLVINNWDRVSSTRADKIGTFVATAGQTYQFRMDYATIDTTKGWSLKASGPSLSETTDWSTIIKPNYGLETSTVTHNAQSGNTTSRSTYHDPALNLLGDVALDPDGLNLATKSAYEENGQGYLRRLSKTLPGENKTTYQYYGDVETRDNPCTPEVEAFRQAGMLKGRTEPDPDKDGTRTSRVLESIYNDAGLVVATRINSDPWNCTTYDTRGRIIQLTVPDFSSRAGNTIQNNHAYENNPLKTMSSDREGFIVSETDLAGNVVYYRDVRGNETRSSYNALGQLEQRTSRLGTERYTYTDYGDVYTISLDNETLATVDYDQYGRARKSTINKITGLKVYSGFYDTLGRQNGVMTILPTQTNGDYPNYFTEFNDYSVSGSVTKSHLNGASLSGGDATYTYDKANRLTNAKLAGHEYTYSFGAQSANCGFYTQSNPNAGKNSNRMTMTKDGVATWYCYDHADRLITTNNTWHSSSVYDEHGNLTRMGKTGSYTNLWYDQMGRNMRISEQKHQIRYARDVQNRLKNHTYIKTNADNTTTTTHTYYGYTSQGDTPDFIQDGSGTVVEKYISLPGGIMLTLRPTQSEAKNKLQATISDLRGNTLTVLDGNGQIKDGLKLYDPYGNIHTATTSFIDSLRSSYNSSQDTSNQNQLQALIANGTLDAEESSLNVNQERIKLANALTASNNFVADTNLHTADYGWAGREQKQTESALTTRLIQMGARAYLSEIGRFTSIDQIEGGVHNPYVYPADPINFQDFTGQSIGPMIVPGWGSGSCAGMASTTCGRTFHSIPLGENDYSTTEKILMGAFALGITCPHCLAVAGRVALRSAPIVAAKSVGTFASRAAQSFGDKALGLSIRAFGGSAVTFVLRKVAEKGATDNGGPGLLDIVKQPRQIIENVKMLYGAVKRGAQRAWNATKSWVSNTYNSVQAKVSNTWNAIRRWW